MSLSYNKLEKKYNKALEKILDLETELYYCRRNKKLTTCTFCNRILYYLKVFFFVFIKFYFLFLHF